MGHKPTVSWDQTHKIDRIHRAHAQKVQNLSRTKRMHSNDNPTPCKFYQKATCSHKIDHEVNGHTYLHVNPSWWLSQKKSDPILLSIGDLTLQYLVGIGELIIQLY